MYARRRTIRKITLENGRSAHTRTCVCMKYIAIKRICHGCSSGECVRDLATKHFERQPPPQPPSSTVIVIISERFHCGSSFLSRTPHQDTTFDLNAGTLNGEATPLRCKQTAWVALHNLRNELNLMLISMR